MSNRNLIVRICAYNFLFYALVFAVLLKAPTIGGAPRAPSAPTTGDDNHFEISADTSEMLAGEALLDALRAGGHVFYVRHFETARRGITDDHYKAQHAHLPLEAFADCAWQRPLSDAGVLLARKAGEIVREYGIPVGSVYASPYCRAMESAVEMFGRQPSVDRDLIFRSDSYPEAAANRHVAESYLSAPPPPGENRIVVGHRPPMDALGGIEEGETVIFRPERGGLRLVARVPATNWVLAGLRVEQLAGTNPKEARSRTLGSRWFAPPRAAYPPLEQLVSAMKAEGTPGGHAE